MSRSPRAYRPGLLIGLASVVLVFALAAIHLQRGGVSPADITVIPDQNVAVLLCVVDAGGEARCYSKEGVVTGKVGRGWLNVCGLAQRPMLPACEKGQDCIARRAAMPTEPFGLVVLEPQPSTFGIPGHRILDVAVLSPSDAHDEATAKVAAGVKTVARCFATATAAVDPADLERPILGRACETGPCRLRNSTVRLALGAEQPAIRR